MPNLWRISLRSRSLQFYAVLSVFNLCFQMVVYLAVERLATMSRHASVNRLFFSSAWQKQHWLSQWIRASLEGGHKHANNHGVGSDLHSAIHNRFCLHTMEINGRGWISSWKWGTPWKCQCRWQSLDISGSCTFVRALARGRTLWRHGSKKAAGALRFHDVLGLTMPDCSSCQIVDCISCSGRYKSIGHGMDISLVQRLREPGNVRHQVVDVGCGWGVVCTRVNFGLCTSWDKLNSSLPIGGAPMPAPGRS